MSSEALERAAAVRSGIYAQRHAGEAAIIRDALDALDALQAALAVAREREQRLRLALRDAIANLDAAVCVDYPLWAALVDEPAAATLAEPGRSRRDPSAVVDGEASLPGSASAAADEPSTSPTDYGPHDHFWRDDAAADEPGETPA